MIAQREPVIQAEHMPQNYQKYLSRNEDEFRSWANTIGPRTSEVVNHFLTSGSEPEQGYKSCASLTKLSDCYGHDRIEKACDRVRCYTSDPAIRNISTILKNGQDSVPSATIESTSNSSGITRGAGYYRIGRSILPREMNMR